MLMQGVHPKVVSERLGHASIGITLDLYSSVLPSLQSEAAQALGLRSSQTMRLIVLPQALRVIIPPMTSQYLNLTKNSSLAVAIGYPDLVSIANTTLNQTGQAVEGIAMIMAVYLVISLTISLFMNLYNRAVALVER